MSSLMMAAGLAAMLQSAAPYYEGVAHDSFAAWSFTSGTIGFSGATRTTSVQALYDTPTQFTGNPAPVVYSIHQVTFDCGAKTAAFINGANYSRSGVVLSAANPTAATPWTDFTTGFQELAATVCAMKP